MCAVIFLEIGSGPGRTRGIGVHWSIWTEVFPGHRSVDRTGAFELYDAPIGVRLAVEEADKSAPLEFDGEVDGDVDGVGNSVRVWQADDRYHLLYYQGRHVAYAVSEDAYRWTRPALGIIEQNGSKENNLVTNVGGDLLKAVFEDPTAPPEERFKGMGCEGALINSETGEVANAGEEVDDEYIQKWWADQEYLGPAYKGPRLILKGRVMGWVSPDRVHWKRTDKILADFPMDGGLSARYDEQSGYYYAYCRIQGVPQEQFDLIGSGVPEDGIFHRAIGLTRTKDFNHWPAPKLLLFPDGQDEPDLSFYGGDYFPYPGRDDLHCMLVQAYHHATDHVDSQLAISRDGLIWQRPERKPIVPVGGPGAPDAAMVYSWGSGIAELPDGNWGSLYGGHTSLHNEPQRGEHGGVTVGPVAAPQILRHRNGCGGSVYLADRSEDRQSAKAQLPLSPGWLDQGRDSAQHSLADSPRRRSDRRPDLRRKRSAERRFARPDGHLERQQQLVRGG